MTYNSKELISTKIKEVIRAMTRFKRLFEPVKIKGVELRNRIVMPAMISNYSTEDGYVTQRLKDYYQERSKGGAGLIIVEASCIDSSTGKTFARQLSIDSDKFISAIKELLEVIHKHGAKAALQLHHGGREVKSKFIRGLQPVAPSSIPIPWGEVPRELTLAEISRLIAHFAEAAGRARKAGFDGIEIHAAHGYLLAQFLSLSANKRQDEYGGDIENRARILIEIIKATRKVLGDDYLILCRINAEEYGIEGRATLEEGQKVASIAQDAGADVIHVSAYGYGKYCLTLTPEVPGALIPLGARIKEAVATPVIVPGRISPELGERAVEEGKVDLIAMGRSLIADPCVPKKLAKDREEDIIPCCGCLNCLFSTTIKEKALQCSVNPITGREREYKIKPARKPKKVIVVGGGPAGMEAARVSALRGHQVTLYERSDKLGGQLILAAIPPHKSRIENLTNYFITQLHNLGVSINLNQEATPSLIKGAKPDVIVIATGVIPFIPEIPGIKGYNVIFAEEALTNKEKLVKRVIIIGGEVIGCETADLLATKGKEVTVTRRGTRMATKMLPQLRWLLLHRLREKGVNMLAEVRYEEITDEGLIITTKDGKRRVISADTIILAAGAEPNIELFNELKGKISEIYLAGDCVEPRNIQAAIHDGFRIAFLL